MSMKFINENPRILRAWIDGKKELMEEYLKDNPDSLFPAFEDEIRAMGIEFEIGEQIFNYMPGRKADIVPVALKYYRLAKELGKENEQEHFLQFFDYKGLDELVPMLLEDYRSDNTSELTRWYISDCLYSIRAREHISEYLDIITRPSYGTNRQMIILLLGKLRSEAAIPALLELLEDETVRTHTITALSEFKREDFRHHFERFTSAEHPGWRKYSREAIEKLDKAKTPEQ